MKIAVFFLFVVALTHASPVEQPAPEADGERSPRQFFSQYYDQQYFYPRLPVQYPFFFQQPSLSYLESAPAEAQSVDASLRAGNFAESRLFFRPGGLICSATSPFAQNFICTTAVPFANGIVPTSAYQMCNTPNNLNKASGTVQLRNGSGARACSFFITLPDNTRDVSFTCSSINLTTGTVTVFDVAADANIADPPMADTSYVATGHQIRIDYVSSTGADNFKCGWKPA